MKFQIASPSHYFTDLRLPWSRHLNEWPEEHFVEVARGIHRNVVKFISHKDQVYALKELATPIAQNEYRLLRELEELGLPVVEPVGLVTHRDENVSASQVGDNEPRMNLENRGLLITNYLVGALPYRIIIQQGISPEQMHQMLDALAELLVRLHLSGFYWGDCSFSNALFRRDAGLMAAYLVDAETGDLLDDLTDRRREFDLDLAHTNIAGDLMDLEASVGLPGGLDPVDLADSLVDRYQNLWAELTRHEVFDPEDQYLIEKRISRLNELGFDVEEMEITTVDNGKQVRMVPRVVEHWHHKRRLASLTGLQVQENQARRLLNSLNRYRITLSEQEGRDVPLPVAAYRWISEVFNPSVQNIPLDLKGGLDDAEIFHEILEHRWYLSEASHKDVGMPYASNSYLENVLKKR
jgi:tRNA A-37 threonylcarbamoyl transferase component Bud32